MRSPIISAFTFDSGLAGATTPFSVSNASAARALRLLADALDQGQATPYRAIVTTKAGGDEFHLTTLVFSYHEYEHA